MDNSGHLAPRTAPAPTELPSRRPGKTIVMADDAPWTGWVYTTRGGARARFEDPATLVRLLSEVAGWPLPGAVASRAHRRAS